jgi:hypothetical protein
MFFWVFPRHQIVVCRHFGTFYRSHLQRLAVQCEVWIVRGSGIFTPVPGRAGASMSNQEEVQVVGGPEWINGCGGGGIKWQCQVGADLVCIVCLSHFSQRKTGQANYTH